MRYKKFQIKGYKGLLQEIDMLVLADVGIVDGSILQTDRVQRGHVFKYNRIYDYIKVDKYLYQRVNVNGDVINNSDNSTYFYCVIPETHPGFNFDLLYKASEYDMKIGFFNGLRERQIAARTILDRYFPEFVKRTLRK